MLSNISKLQVQIENKSYQLFCDSDSPLPHVKEALFQFQKYVGQIEDKIKESEDVKKKAEEEKSKVEQLPKEEPKQE